MGSICIRGEGVHVKSRFVILIKTIVLTFTIIVYYVASSFRRASLLPLILTFSISLYPA